jgi:hypothetical protein
VARTVNCQNLPVNINGAVSEMDHATLWAASNGVRVVNISWSGRTNAVPDASGLFLKTNANGILIMAAVCAMGFISPALPCFHDRRRRQFPQSKVLASWNPTVLAPESSSQASEV